MSKLTPELVRAFGINPELVDKHPFSPESVANAWQSDIDERDKRIAELEAELDACKWEHPEFGTEEKHTEVVFEQVTPSTYNGTSTKYCAIHGGIGRPCDCISCKLNSTQAV